MPGIDQAKILIIATHGFEQDELLVPRRELKAAGATVHLAAPQRGPIRGWQRKDWGESVTPEKTLEEVDAADYDALVLPGGQINPDLLRVEPRALALIRAFIDAGKIVAAICHAPWLLIEVDALCGRQVTSYKSIRTDIKNAGGKWVDEEVVVDQGLITSRNPGDLQAFVGKIIEEVQKGGRLKNAAA